MGKPQKHPLQSRITGEDTVAADQLLANPNNWRTHPKEQRAALEGLLDTVGWVQRVIVNEVTGHIVDGHLRAEVALARSEDVPVVYVRLTEQEERLVLAALDPIGGLAGTDQGMLDQLLEGIEVEDAGLQALIDSLRVTGDDEPEKGETGDDDTPELQVATVSVEGDVWLLGRHRVMCGSATEPSQIATLMGGVQADLVWTDPPYNVAIEGKAGKILNDDMADSAFHEFLLQVYAGYFDIMRPGACIYVAHADSERANFTRAFVEAGLKLSQVLIWVKQSATLSRQDFNWQHEPILYGWKEGAGHYFCGDFTRTTVIDDDIDVKGLKREELLALVAELRAQVTNTVLRHDRPTKSELHPTMKPVDLVRRMIEWSSKPGEVVADFFGGSGSTLIAAQKIGRTARIMELDPKYADVIVRRWQEFTGQTATREDDGAEFNSITPVVRAPKVK